MRYMSVMCSVTCSVTCVTYSVLNVNDWDEQVYAAPVVVIVIEISTEYTHVLDHK